ncbi:MAG: sugar ABC transporter substrate-binding protein [bacterium]|nr:sugar ABC transporter substrate-binding protein [bacterium]
MTGIMTGIAQADDFAYQKLVEYAEAVEIGTQASFDSLRYKDGDVPRVAYLPPATEFNYYIAIGEGIKASAEKMGIDTFMLAPQSGADINGQMGMLQDVISQGVDAIILSTHDEHAAAPLVQQAVEQGILLLIVNSDITDFPAPVHAITGYRQRYGTHKIGEYAVEKMQGKQAVVGVIEGLPGYHSTERCGGFLDAVEGKDNFKVVTNLSGNWNTEGGNVAAMDILQAHPDINVIFCANDYEALGAAMAIQALGKGDIMLLGNDGDTAALEEIHAGSITATVNTTPFVMGQIAMQMVADGLKGKFKGGYVESPLSITDQSDLLQYLQQPEKLYPKPSQKY